VAKNRLSDLNNILFCSLERLNNEELKGADLNVEIARSLAIAKTAEQVTRSAGLSLHAQIAAERDMLGNSKLPRVLSEGA